MIEGVEVVRNARAKVMRLSVDPATGRVRLTVPKRMALARAEAWARDKADWIAAQRAALPQAVPFVDGAVVPVAGCAVRLVWDAAAGRTPVLRRPGEGRDDRTHAAGFPIDPIRPTPFVPSDVEGRAPGATHGVSTALDTNGGEDDASVAEPVLVCGGPPEAFATRIERWLRREALCVLTEDTAHYAAKAGVSVAQVAVADPKARWGSCSSTGAIRYSWRLLLAPPAVRRATVAHEVAHRVHMHHGPAFHTLVAELFEGDPAAARRWLRAYGAQLHWYGRASSS